MIKILEKISDLGLLDLNKVCWFIENENPNFQDTIKFIGELN